MTPPTTTTLAGEPCTSALLTIPGVGLWYASVDLANSVALSGQVELRILDTVWSGTVIAGGVVEGRARYRIVAGRGGWGRELSPKAYANDAGVQASRVIADAASEAGEPTPLGTPDLRVALGVHYARPRAPASFLLNTIAPGRWWAASDGVVQFGDPPEATTPDLPVIRRDPAGRCVELAATDTLARCLPGATTDFGTAVDAEIEAGSDGVRVRLYAAHSAAATDRRLAAHLRILDALDPVRKFRGITEYRIVTQVSERLNLQPVRTRSDMPDLARVPVRAGIPGFRAQHALGARVLVAFVDSDPSRPAVVGFEEPGGPGWMPLTLELGGPGALGVARTTDAIVAGPFGGTIVGGSLRVKAVL